jgi:3'(2'), 5'-bisphosphate nucleotidase
VVGALRAAFPEDIIISEEAPDDPRRCESSARVWYVDPIDGTKDFIRGAAGFAVMIGLCVGARPTLGAVYQPVGDRMFWGQIGEGEGAWMQDADGTRALACSTVSSLEEIRLVASKSHRTGAVDKIKNALGIVDEMNIGSVGLKIGLIALGDRDLYVNASGKCKAWDTCAPEAILVAAGGKLTDLSGHALRYDVPELRHLRGLIASNRVLHDAVVAKLAPIFPEKH